MVREIMDGERIGRDDGGSVGTGVTGCEGAEAGDDGPWRQQAILGRRNWNVDALRDIVRQYALETLSDSDAVPVIDETVFLKQGKASCGVARQYTGSAGKITNCQIGVFAWLVEPRPASLKALPRAPGDACRIEPARIIAWSLCEEPIRPKPASLTSSAQSSNSKRDYSASSLSSSGCTASPPVQKA